MARTASCSCGALRLEVEGDPLRVSVCHCLACQQRTGSVFGAQARFPRETVRVTGETREWDRISDEGERSTQSFCPTCAATVFYVIHAMPDVIAVPVGGFADPGFPRPVFSVWEERKHAWVDVPGDDVEHYR